MTGGLHLAAPATALVLCSCVVVTQADVDAREMRRYQRVQAIAKLDFLPGGLVRADVDDARQIMFEPYSRLPGKAVSCRSDVIVGATGDVTHICTACTDESAADARSASENYARRLRYKAGAEGQRSTMTFAYAPQRTDGSLILKRIAPPATGCEPKTVTP